MTPDEVLAEFTRTGRMTRDQMDAWVNRFEVARQRECENGGCVHAGSVGAVWSSIMAMVETRDLLGRRTLRRRDRTFDEPINRGTTFHDAPVIRTSVVPDPTRRPQ